MLDEMARRKPDWVEGEWVTLCDGQAWSFPKPRLKEYRPVFVEGKAKFVGVSLNSFGRGFTATLDELIATDGGIEQIQMVATLAADLLARNYDLDPEQLGSLLAYVQDVDGHADEENHEMWTRICNVAAGIGPKNTIAG